MINKSKRIPHSIKRLYPNVTQIIDAKHSIKIHVNEKDCKNGEPMHSNECALAKALKREYKVDAAIVGLGASYIIKGNKATRFHTPTRIQREIVSFDRNQDFAEGDYVLIPKPKSLKFGNISGKHKTKRNSHQAIRHNIKSARVRTLMGDN